MATLASTAIYQFFAQVEATAEELSEKPDTDDTPRNTEVVYNERLLEEAMRRSMSMWRYGLLLELKQKNNCVRGGPEEIFVVMVLRIRIIFRGIGCRI